MRRWNWLAEGFAHPPRLVHATHRQLVYRVWGGTATKLGSPTRPGVCLSGRKPASRVDAERLFAVWEWGNSCLWVTTFEVIAGTPMFVGRVDPGQNPMPALGATWAQILIEQPVSGKLREIGTQRLHNDLGGRWVSSRAGHA